ncbi:hypothetical protein KSP39_PZI009091 [Platanthera zijinensis]|uniref:Uncharacterized protein n=1 Tax=Platanthera zijinensis TaxID=2320716 RepID=A0AAP0BLG3_9ASPA
MWLARLGGGLWWRNKAAAGGLGGGRMRGEQEKGGGEIRRRKAAGNRDFFLRLLGTTRLDVGATPAATRRGRSKLAVAGRVLSRMTIGAEPRVGHSYNRRKLVTSIIQIMFKRLCQYACSNYINTQHFFL